MTGQTRLKGLTGLTDDGTDKTEGTVGTDVIDGTDGKARTFLVELHLDDVLEVLLVVELNVLFTKLIDKYHKNIH